MVTNKTKIYFFVTLTLCGVLNALVRKSSDLLAFLTKNIMQHYFRPSAKLLLTGRRVAKEAFGSSPSQFYCDQKILF